MIPDSGEIFLEGQKVNFTSPIDARNAMRDHLSRVIDYLLDVTETEAVEIGRRFFRWQGKTYGRSDDGLALALPNPWNPQRVLYLYLANSAVELWHMTHGFQRGLQSWALFRGGEVSAKGFHELDALSQDLKEAPPPVVNQPAL